jgi:MFS family permease
MTAPAIRAEDLPAARRVTAFVLILATYVFYSFAWNTIDTLRPYIREAAGLSIAQAGWLYSAQSLGALLGALAIGQLADRFGRRLLLVLITAGYGLALLAGLAAHDFASLLAQRLVLGVFLGGVFSVAVGLYVGLFAPHIRGRLAALVGAMFNGGLVLQGWMASLLLERDWTLLIWFGGLPPLVLALGCWLLVPDDRRIVPWGGAPPAPAVRKLPISELLQPGLRRTTLMLALLSGLNFFAYQAFSGWVTTYLKDVRGLGGAGIGALVAWQGLGSVVGGFAWGWVADRFGRRVGAAGFVAAGVMIVLYLRAPNDLQWLAVIGFVYGMLISASVVWGPWFAELYPAHLRSTAASIFLWGRVIGFFAPPLTAAVAQSAGLAAGMLLAALLFMVAALLWWRLPETLPGRRRG